MYLRIKGAKVVKEHGTQPPTAEEAKAIKQNRIEEQASQRTKFEQERKKTVTVPEPVKSEAEPVADN